MGTKTHNNYEDLITFTRASAGHALRPVSYGTELVTNTTPNFDLSPSVGSFDTGVDAVAGKIYMIDVSATVTVSSVSLRINNSTSNWSEVVNLTIADGDRRIALQALTSGDIQINRNDASATANIATLSIKEVSFDQPDGTLTLFEHPDNIPRVEWDSAGNRLGLLVEESRTNLIPYSEDFNSWGKVRSTVNTDVIQAPDGTTTGDALVATAVNDDHAVGQAVSVTAQPYTFTAFIKAGDKSFVRLWQTNDSILADFDLTNLTVGYTLGSPSATSIEDVGNGWRRCSITMTPTAGTRTFRIYAMEADNDKLYLGDGSTEDIYIWGAQVEAGSFPTSYIKTTGATATRSTDVASIPVADFGFNDDGYSFVIEAEAPYAINTNQDSFFVTLDGDVDLYMYANNTGTQGSYQIRSNSGADLVLAKNDVTITDLMKLGFGFKKNDCALTLNGAVSSNDTSATLPTGVTDLLLGRSGSGGQKFVHIKSIKYYPRRLTDAQLQALTEPRSTPTLSLTFDGQESSYKENYIHG
jgi:hypothetical protein